MPNSPEHLHLLDPHPLYTGFVMRAVVAPLLFVNGGLEHHGAEVFSEVEGPVIASPNHRHIIDTFVVAQAIYEATEEHIHFMAKGELWEYKFIGRVLGKLIEWGGSFPIDRKSGVTPAETKEHVDDLMANNAILGVFPEEHRREGPYINPKHIVGIPLIAARTGATVVPVGIAGTEKKDPRPYRCEVGDPIFVEQASNRKEEVKIAKEAKVSLVTAMQVLLDSANRWSTRDYLKISFDRYGLSNRLR